MEINKKPPERWFASDNNASVHPSIMQALVKANSGHAVGYGDDPYTEAALRACKHTFGEESETFFVWNGTGANVMALAAVLRPWEGVVCTDVGHIATDETGAPERIAGIKIFTAHSDDGKLTTDMIEETVSELGWVHSNLPRMVSVSQPTETGLVYTPDELAAIGELCKKRGFLMHVDGARLSNAAVFLGTGLKDTAGPADLISFGGTKNGLMFGEALVFMRVEDTPGIGNLRKNVLQLASKMRYLSVQYSVYLEDGLWKDNALKANAAAHYLKEKAESVLGLSPEYAVQTNAMFTRIPPEIIEKITSEWFFYVINQKEGLVRWMCSWDNRTEDIDGFIRTLKAAFDRD